ncbi:MAG: hypothetical protein WC875_04165 [Candidatus Absconditabacterales bacterium]|jgi:hypothetical protein
MQKGKTKNDLQAGCLALMQMGKEIFVIFITKRVGDKVSFMKLFKASLHQKPDLWALIRNSHDFLKDWWTLGALHQASFTTHVLDIQTTDEYCLLQKEEKEQLKKKAFQILGPLEQKKTAAIKEYTTYDLNVPQSRRTLRKIQKLTLLAGKKSAAIKECSTFETHMRAAGLIPEKEKE